MISFALIGLIGLLAAGDCQAANGRRMMSGVVGTFAGQGRAGLAAGHAAPAPRSCTAPSRVVAWGEAAWGEPASPGRAWQHAQHGRHDRRHERSPPFVQNHNLKTQFKHSAPKTGGTQGGLEATGEKAPLALRGSTTPKSRGPRLPTAAFGASPRHVNPRDFSAATTASTIFEISVGSWPLTDGAAGSSLRPRPPALRSPTACEPCGRTCPARCRSPWRGPPSDRSGSSRWG